MTMGALRYILIFRTVGAVLIYLGDQRYMRVAYPSKHVREIQKRRVQGEKGQTGRWAPQSGQL